MLDSNSNASGIGRLGELFVYHTLTDLIQRNKEQHHNFDEISSLDFPTGHPVLGVGRLVHCHWCNADSESMKPYDFEVDVQGKLCFFSYVYFFIPN